MISNRYLVHPAIYSVCLLLLLVVFTGIGSASVSDKRESVKNWMDGFLETVGSGDEYNPDKTIDFGFLPGPFYTPEMKLGIGLAAIGLYKTNREDDQERISTLSISGFASVSKAIGVKVENQSFFLRDRLRFFVDCMVLDAPEKYWGIGYELNSNDDIREDYDEVSFQASPRIYYQLLKYLYVGTGWDFVYNNAKNTVPGGLFHQDNPHGTRIYSSGYSIHLMSDTRDFIPNPYKGYLLNLDYYEYKDQFGSDADYSITELTCNKYWAVKDNNILAFQFFLRSADDDVPWSRLSKIGGANQMRGYWEGRYRDKRLFATQLEYRHKLHWRHGVVAWVGAGAIAPEFDEFDKGEILPNAGIGYRLAFKYRSNVRLDLGFGKGEIGFYFNVNEAF